MSAGDGFFTLQNSEISNNLKSKVCFSTEENDLIDNKGDSSESAKAWDNNFSERLANFMKNSKSLLENIDKKHSNVKFQYFENNSSNEKFNTAHPESPSIALGKLEETLLQLDDSKSQFIKKEDNKHTMDHSCSINPKKIDKKDKVYDARILNDFIISRKSNARLKSDNYFTQDYDVSSSNLSLSKIEESHPYYTEDIKGVNKLINARHFRHLTHSGATKLLQNESHFSKVVDFKLALFKKRTNSLKGINKNNIEEGIYSTCVNVDRNNGFQNVINAMFNQNQCSNFGKILSSESKTKNNNFNKNKLEMSYILKDNIININKELNEREFDNKNHKILRQPSSLSSNISIEETFEEIKNLSKQSSETSSKVSIFNIDNENKLEKSEIRDKVSSSETNISPVCPNSFKFNSPLEIIKVIKRNDLNEKENISEPYIAEKEISDSQPKKIITKKSHNFQEALRIDELENELIKMKSNLKEKDKKIIVSETDLKPKYKSIVTEVNSRYQDEAVGDKKKVEIYKVRNFELKSSEDCLINGPIKTVYSGENKPDNFPYKSPQQYSSIEDYNPNNSSVLRNKIKDLESQIQDLQEANENAASFMLSFKENNLIEAKNNTNAIISELVEKNQSLRDEVDRLRQSIPALKGDTISSQFLRQELENLKEDLYTLKHQNTLIVKENITLKNELKKRESNHDSHVRHEDRKPILYQKSEHTKSNQPTYNGTFELNNHSKDLSDSDNSLGFLTNDNQLNSQAKSMPVNNFTKDTSKSKKQQIEISKNLTHNISKKSNLFSTKNIRQMSEFDDSQSNVEKEIDKRKKVNNSYERDIMNLSNDSTDSILSDANKEIIFESELEDNIKSRLEKPIHENLFESEFQFEMTSMKKESKFLEGDFESVKNNKFSTLGKTAYAPRASFDITVGDVVKFIRQGGRISKGLVHYIGPLPNRKDTYLGIELEIEDGKHDGVYEGKRYFQCIKNKGVFVAFNKIIMVYSKKN